MRPLRETREAARRMRREEGLSINEIALKLSVAKSSVSYWVRDIELTPAQADVLRGKRANNAGRIKGSRKNYEIARALRLQAQEAGRAKAREGSILHGMGCMLYWAEGAKDRNQLNFVNSNPGMMLMFLRFLQEEMRVNPETDVSIRIHCHSNDPVEMQRVEQYWLTLLSLPQEALRKTIFKQGSLTSKKVLPNGVCSIRVKRSTYLTQHIFGAVQEYSKFEMPELLL